MPESAKPAEPDQSEPLAGFSRVIVDGFNVLGSRPDGWWRDRPAAMLRLLGRLERLASESAATLTVVFDGREHAAVVGEAANVEAAFAGRGRDAADRQITRLVREDPNPGRVLVVSSDRRLQAAVKAAGGARLGSGQFLRDHLSDSPVSQVDPPQ